LQALLLLEIANYRDGFGGCCVDSAKAWMLSALIQVSIAFYACGPDRLIAGYELQRLTECALQVVQTSREA
jgi:hypothetical protein